MYSIEELANDFRKLGIRAGDTVMLHASVRAVGRQTFPLQDCGRVDRLNPVKPREAPTVNMQSPIRVTLLYPGVLTPFLSISMAFSNLFNRVSSFLASVIQRQYSLRWV
jgi:hypothetical protein